MTDDEIDAGTEAALDRIRARFLPGAAPYLEVLPGWYALVIELDQALSGIDPDYQLVQVKQKFGGLRYYIEPTPDRPRPGFGDLINAAELRSEGICELCGAEGATTQQGSWARTLCAADAVATAAGSPGPASH